MNDSNLWPLDLNVKGLNILKKLADIDQAHYPELTFKLFIVNTPMIFSSLWNMIKYWFDKRTLEKIYILSSSEKAKLLEFISPDALPAHYGGECTCNHMKSGCIPALKSR